MKKILYSFLFIFLTILSFPTYSRAAEAYIKDLNYDVTFNSNGDVNVIENWNVKLNNSNTLYNNFEIGQNENDISITNVSVSETTNGTKTNFKKISKNQFYLDSDTFYALELPSDFFEIAWSAPSGSDSDIHQYQISYTIKNAITCYSDCSDFYWYFLGSNFSIPAQKITGTIHLPNGISNKKDIRAWGHIPNLDGNIKIKSKNEIFFRVNAYKPNNYLNIRVVLPPNIIQNSKTSKSQPMLPNILEEEKNSAETANSQRFINIIISVVFLSIAISSIGGHIINIKNYDKSRNQPTVDYDYFRDIPNLDMSPGEAGFLINSKYDSAHAPLNNIFLATILDLTNKKYLSIKTMAYFTKKKDIISDQIHDIGKYVTALDLTEKGQLYKGTCNLKKDHLPDDLKKDEKIIFDFILKLFGTSTTLPLPNITKYVKDNFSEFKTMMENACNKIEVEQHLKGYFRNTQSSFLNESLFKETINIFLLIGFWYLRNLLGNFILIFAIVPIINLFLISKEKALVLNLSKLGIDEWDKWDALKRFLAEYSLINEKDMISVELWEKYLIYATVFGVATNVLKNMPLDKENEENNYKDNSINDQNFQSHWSNFSNEFETAFTTAYNSFINETINFTSENGSGGGFSTGTESNPTDTHIGSHGGGGVR